MPAIIIPIPLITRPQAHACRGLTDQLRQFLTSPEGYPVDRQPAHRSRRSASRSAAPPRSGRICRLRRRAARARGA